jgi:hypothetical protein
MPHFFAAFFLYTFTGGVQEVGKDFIYSNLTEKLLSWGKNQEIYD